MVKVLRYTPKTAENRAFIHLNTNYPASYRANNAQI
jgi:hypothetical protein